MAEGMVARLEARLVSEPGDVDGWIMLMRSRQTLGDAARARKALRDAIAANPGARSQLEQAARELGIQVFLCPTDVADNYVGTPQVEAVVALQRVAIPNRGEIQCPAAPDVRSARRHIHQ